MTIPVAFDVLGTCFSLDAAVESLRVEFKDELAATGLRPESLVDDWFHSAQRDFTYLSMNDAYTPISSCLAADLPRILLMAGLMGPMVLSTPFASPIPAARLATTLQSLTRMVPRPSLAPCSALFHSTGKFALHATTNGGEVNTRNLYDLALGKEESKNWGVWSCDFIKVAKPAPVVYDAIWKSINGTKERKGWFIAAHSWDLQAAKKAGFKTAWVAYEERVPCSEIFGTPDVVATDLEDAARQIIALEA